MDDEQKVEYHKGSPCIYEPAVLCQEGYCIRCMIYLELEDKERYGQ